MEDKVKCNEITSKENMNKLDLKNMIKVIIVGFMENL